ncbi:MAG: tetratricopeptide repeat protein [Candidatus Korobacteraceae bacterium]
MRYQVWIAPVLFTLLIASAQAQFGGAAGGFSGAGNVHVRVVFDNDRTAGANLLVRLMQGSSNTPVANTYTNSNGEAEFSGVRVGDYNVVVSGDGIETTDSGVFQTDERKVTQSQYITVRRLQNSGAAAAGWQASTVSAGGLNVSPKAQKELDKANKAMAEQDFKKTLEHLNKAIAIEPHYAAAYNNLGVLYSRMNDDAHEQEALEKAISLDDHFTAAYVNLAKLYLRQKNFPKAEPLLEKAASGDPNNADSLMLLADAQYMDHHYDAAIATARAAASSKTHPAFVHYIAARAYDKENRREEALAELQLFLKEEPTGPRADYVRATLQSQQRQQQGQ